MNPTSQPAQQGGGGDLEQLVAGIAELPDPELMDFLEALETALEPRGIDLEMAAGATQRRKSTRQQQQPQPQEEAPAAQGQQERSGRVTVR